MQFDKARWPGILKQMPLNRIRLGSFVARFGRAQQAFNEVDLDRIPIRDSPVLQHLSQALSDQTITAGRLAAGLHAPMVSAPVLPRTNRDSAEIAPGPTISVATYNLGLLGRSYLNTQIRMPELAARRARFARCLLNKDIDVWLLQELWEPADLHRLTTLATAAGYRVYSALGQARSAHGLAILIRSRLIDDGMPVIAEGAFYRHQYPLEYRPGPRIRRAWISLQFTCQPWATRVAIFNTHLSPFPAFWRHRNAQARTFGLAARRVSMHTTVIAGGDLNADQLYSANTHEVGGLVQQSGLWNCATAHALVRYYGDLTDISERGGLPREEVTIEAQNPIHYRMYGHSVSDARLDHLMISTDSPVKVQEVARDFLDPVVQGKSGPVPLSDHYALRSVLCLCKKQRVRAESTASD
jgi:hypothetical protein